jgi:dihydroflavonol-4-reductase
MNSCGLSFEEGQGRTGPALPSSGTSHDHGRVVALLEKVSGVPGPTRRIPIALLYTLAVFYEAYAHINDRPVLISLASARLITEQAGRSLYNHAKSERELGLAFCSVEETLTDVIAWYCRNDYLPPRTRGTPLSTHGGAPTREVSA